MLTDRQRALALEYANMLMGGDRIEIRSGSTGYKPVEEDQADIEAALRAAAEPDDVRLLVPRHFDALVTAIMHDEWLLNALTASGKQTSKLADIANSITRAVIKVMRDHAAIEPDNPHIVEAAPEMQRLAASGAVKFSDEVVSRHSRFVNGGHLAPRSDRHRAVPEGAKSAFDDMPQAGDDHLMPMPLADLRGDVDKARDNLLAVVADAVGELLHQAGGNTAHQIGGALNVAIAEFKAGAAR